MIKFNKVDIIPNKLLVRGIFLKTSGVTIHEKKWG